MADMVRPANIPHTVLPPPGTAYRTADEWYVALAEMHLAQLVFVAQYRLRNMLLNDSGNLVAAVDWEFACAAPIRFILDPPWWLLLNMAETRASDLDDWTRTYDLRLKTWLSAMMRAKESLSIDQPGGGPLPVALSTYMQESWEPGRFWLSYGARNSWPFGTVYWKFLDELFFCERGNDVSKTICGRRECIC
ncbi:hypothetical protein VTI74DRAFT_9777 [Chaetomium olivicolor]